MMKSEDQKAEVIPTVGDSLAALANAMHIGMLTKATESEDMILPELNGFPRPNFESKFL
jgi:hypothetical protein